MMTVGNPNHPKPCTKSPWSRRIRTGWCQFNLKAKYQSAKQAFGRADPVYRPRPQQSVSDQRTMSEALLRYKHRLWTGECQTWTEKTHVYIRLQTS
ncbi:hypothetical protein BaRGS_00000004 [Batillaria attramentaria]|uniref:Uncharacterized protein n=1 Tax=Batillaria attramentaria TaxID=370345 RepID=A0ABD0MAC4_9CAEN